MTDCGVYDGNRSIHKIIFEKQNEKRKTVSLVRCKQKNWEMFSTSFLVRQGKGKVFFSDEN